eukprot:scaffold150935_cov32-Tisochrysis_lutea.AAC.2
MRSSLMPPRQTCRTAVAPTLSSKAPSSVTNDTHGTPFTLNTTSPGWSPAAAAGPSGRISATTKTPRCAPSARILPSLSFGKPSRNASSYVW